MSALKKSFIQILFADKNLRTTWQEFKLAFRPDLLSNENIYLIACIQFLPFYLIKLEYDDILEATISCNTNPVIIPYEWTKGKCVCGRRQTIIMSIAIRTGKSANDGMVS